MSKNWQSIRAAARNRLKSAANFVAGRVATALLAVAHRCDRAWISDRGGAITRTIGPWLPEHRTGFANLRAAFPEKTDAEIETILRGVWDNLGRVGAEIAHLPHLLRRPLQAHLYRLRPRQHRAVPACEGGRQAGGDLRRP